MLGHGFAFGPALSDEDRNQSLQELEGQTWSEGDFPSSLIRTCHALRQKPLRAFTIEDFRVIIGQQLSLQYLIPLAIEHLQRDPLVSGDFYPGDLLATVLKVPSSFWQTRPDLRRTVEDIVAHAKPFPSELRPALLVFQST